MLSSSSHRRQPSFSVSSLSDLIDTLQSHDELLAEQHDQQRQHNATSIEQLRALHSFCSQLQHRNTALTADFDSLTAVHRQLQAEYSSARSNSDTLQSELKVCRRERKEESERAEAQRIRHTAALSDLTQQLMAITASHQQKDQEIVAISRERDTLQRRIQTLEDELADSTTECEQLTGQVTAAEEERDEWVEENTRLETRLTASEAERERMAAAKERVECELQAHLDIAATIHGLSRKAMAASREGSRAVACKTEATERAVKARTALGELDVNRT